MGTRFLASEEAHVHRAYKARVVQSTAEETVYTHLFDIEWPDAAHRVLRNKAIEAWEAAGRPGSRSAAGGGDHDRHDVRGGDARRGDQILIFRLCLASLEILMRRRSMRASRVV